MSNLGFQTIYEHLNRLPQVVCERVFFPDPEDIDEYARTGTAPFSLESQRPLAEFDLIGFSVTYEGTTSMPCGSCAWRGSRRGRRTAAPMTRGGDGGVCAFSNPEPMAPSWT